MKGWIRVLHLVWVTALKGGGLTFALKGWMRVFHLFLVTALRGSHLCLEGQCGGSCRCLKGLNEGLPLGLGECSEGALPLS